MHITDIKDGMKIRATADWADCWKAGDEFVVKMDENGTPTIQCHDPENGPSHGLDGTCDEDGNLPEFEAVL